MRRKDREVTDAQTIDAIIASCDCCRLGLYDGEEVYIVPMNFGYAHQNSRRIFYFHSAAVGRKIDLIAHSDRVSFQMDAKHRVKVGKKACEYSFYYQSVMGTGRVSFITDPLERNIALQSIMEHYTNASDWEFDLDCLRAVQMIKLEVQTISCKEHLPAES